MGLVVEVKSPASGIALFWVGDKSVDGVKVWICLHPKLAHEAAIHGWETLVGPHIAMPHIPLVNITNSWVLHHQCRTCPATPGAARVVYHGILLRLLMHKVGQEVLVDISSRKNWISAMSLGPCPHGSDTRACIAQ